MTNATPGPVELKPCPFCGSDELSHGWSAPGFDGSNCTGNVECHNCNALIYTHGGEAEAITAWNTRADSHHRLVEAMEAFAFVGEDDPKDTQAVWEMIYRDRVQDWFSYEDFERARDVLAALKEAGR